MNAARIRKLAALLMALLLTLGLCACGASRKDPQPDAEATAPVPSSTPQTDAPQESEPEQRDTNILVAYFSCTGTTEALAGYAADILAADIYEIAPVEPYTADDLNYNDNGSRANREQDDAEARPEISGIVESIAQYDTILIGYPIWHGQAPRIISTFLESFDFSGKTIVPFCTSGGSGIGSSAENLHGLAPDADWEDGRRFSSGTTREELAGWLDGLQLVSESEENEMRIMVTVNGVDFSAKLNDSAAAKAFYAMLPLTLDMAELNGNENAVRSQTA